MEHFAKLSHSITLRILAWIQSRHRTFPSPQGPLCCQFINTPTPNLLFLPSLSFFFFLGGDLQCCVHFCCTAKWFSYTSRGFPGGASGKESASQCQGLKRCQFDPWVRKIPWRRKWQPNPAFLPGKSHRQESLAGYSPWNREESDTT